MSDPQLNAILSKVRRRSLLLGGAAGVSWAVAAVAVVMVVGIWLDLVWELSPQLRPSS